MGSIKKHNGSTWVDVPVKKWNGSAWVEPEVKKWDGSKWVVINQQQYITTWDATWSQSYQGTNAKRTDTRGNNNLMQGDSGEDSWNINRALCGFGDIKSALAGAKIDDVKLYLRSEHWWYHAGGTAVIGYHNHASEPNTFSHSKYGVKNQKFDYRGHAQWIDMPNDLGEGIRDGIYKGFSLFASSANKNYYGEINGAGSSYKPKLKITYTK